MGKTKPLPALPVLSWQQCTANAEVVGATVVARKPGHFMDAFGALGGTVLTEGRHRFDFAVKGNSGVRLGVAQPDATLDPVLAPLPVGFDGQGISLSTEGVASFGWLAKGASDRGPQWDGAEGTSQRAPATGAAKALKTSRAWGINISDGGVCYAVDLRTPGAFLHSTPDWTTSDTGEVAMVVDMKHHSLSLITDGGAPKDAGPPGPAALDHCHCPPSPPSDALAAHPCQSTPPQSPTHPYQSTHPLSPTRISPPTQTQKHAHTSTHPHSRNLPCSVIPGVTLPEAVRLWVLIPGAGTSVTLVRHEQLPDSGPPTVVATSESAHRWHELQRRCLPAQGCRELLSVPLGNGCSRVTALETPPDYTLSTCTPVGSGLSHDGGLAPAITAFSTSLSRGMADDVLKMFSEVDTEQDSPNVNPVLTPMVPAAAPSGRRPVCSDPEPGSWTFRPWASLERAGTSLLDCSALATPVVPVAVPVAGTPSPASSKRPKRTRAKR